MFGRNIYHIYQIFTNIYHTYQIFTNIFPHLPNIWREKKHYKRSTAQPGSRWHQRQMAQEHCRMIGLYENSQLNTSGSEKNWKYAACVNPMTTSNATSDGESNILAMTQVETCCPPITSKNRCSWCDICLYSMPTGENTFDIINTQHPFTLKCLNFTSVNDIDSLRQLLISTHQFLNHFHN